jgi:Flp pilus assembly protein TadD
MRVLLHTIGLTIAGLLLAEAAGAVSPESLRQQGLAYRQQERYPEAIAALKQAVERDPDNLAGRVLLGWTQHKAGQGQAAAATLQQSFQQNPFDVPTLNALGIVYLVGGQLPAAIATHTWAALLKPNNEIALYNLSLACERIGQYDWAVATAKAAAKLEPTNPHPLIAIAIGQLGNGNKTAAQQTFQQAVVLDSRYGDAAFLTYLHEAGFSQNQIQRSQQLQQTLR